MKIGLTYDLRSEYLKMGYSEEETAEFDQESTIDAIESALNNLNFETQRIGHIKQLVNELALGNTWDLVFNICEGMYGNGRESQVPALLDAYRIPYVFSSPLVLGLTLDKSLTKRVLRDAGIKTADFYLVHKLSDIAKNKLPFPLFVKPAMEGTGKGINENSIVNNHKELEQQCDFLLNEYNQAVLVETFLNGREFTVGIVGSKENAKALGGMEIVLKDNSKDLIYSYVNKEQCEDFINYIPIKGPEKILCEKLALDAYKILECEDAARVDIRMDAMGAPNFIEINPLPGMHPEHSDLPILCNLNGINYLQLMEMILDSAIKKCRKDVLITIK